MIEEPGCSAGSFNSFSPETGPLPIHLMSFAILNIETAYAFKQPERCTISSREPWRVK